MSYMSSLELKARNFSAIDILNKLRQKMLERKDSFEDKHANILLESLELNEPSHSNKVLQYSLYGLNNNIEESSALELSSVIKNTADLISDDIKNSEYYLSIFKTYLTEKKYLKPKDFSETEEVLKLINSSIDNIYSKTITNSGTKPISYKGL